MPQGKGIIRGDGVIVGSIRPHVGVWNVGSRGGRLSSARNASSPFTVEIASPSSHISLRQHKTREHSDL